MKKLLLLLFTFCLLSNLSFGQDESTSYVDLNPDELKSLISKLVVAKRQKMSYQQYMMYRQIQLYKKKRRYQLKSTGDQKTAFTPPSTPTPNYSDKRYAKIESMLLDLQRKQQKPNNNNSAVSRQELNKMKSDILVEIEDLKNDINDMPITNDKEPIIIKAPEGNSENLELYEQLAKSMNDMNQSIDAMQKKMNSSSTSNSDNSKLEREVAQLSRSIQDLEKKMNNIPNSTGANQYEKELRDIKQMIAKINNTKSTHTKETIQTNTISNNNNTNTAYLTSVIKGREISQILFANASHALTEDSKNTIRNIAKLMKQHDRLDVLIAGYTSSQGSPLYNQELSLQRTESVKRFLMELGVHATHIFSEYHGIDYNAANDSNARRVEVKILVRK